MSTTRRTRPDEHNSPLEHNPMSTPGDDSADDIAYPSSIGFLLVHLGCFGVFWSGMTVSAVVLGVVLYLVRIFAIGAGYHRYFSHRTFRTGRIFQFVLGFVAQTSAQRGILWWAAMHRRRRTYRCGRRF